MRMHRLYGKLITFVGSLSLMVLNPQDMLRCRWTARFSFHIQLLLQFYFYYLFRWLEGNFMRQCVNKYRLSLYNSCRVSKSLNANADIPLLLLFKQSRFIPHVGSKIIFSVKGNFCLPLWSHCVVADAVNLLQWFH